METSVIQKLHNDETFINHKRFGNDIERLMERYPDGVPNRIIAQALALTEEQVDALYGDVVAKLRTSMRVE